MAVKQNNVKPTKFVKIIVSLLIIVVVWLVTEITWWGDFIRVILYAMIACIIPEVLFFEIYHWARNIVHISHPLRKGVWSSSTFGIATAFLMIKFAKSKDSVLGLIFLSPLIIIGFIIMGILVGQFYKSRKRPLFPRSRHEQTTLF